MDESPTAAPNNASSRTHSWADEPDWWKGVAEEDSLAAPNLGSGLLLTPFLPPPPRPAFLEVPGSSCDLCGWAWQEGGEGNHGDLLLVFDDRSAAVTKANESLMEDTPHEFGLVLALVIVSIVSAVIGAIVMVTVIQCRNRFKNIRSRGVCSLCRTVSGNPDRTGTNVGGTEAPDDEDNKGNSHSSASAVTSLGQQPNPSAAPLASLGQNMWAWLTGSHGGLHSNTPSPRVQRHQHCTPENHYTLSSTGRMPPTTIVGASSIVEEALYAELDHRDEDGAVTPQYEDPSYQNMGYQNSETDPDGPVSCRLSVSSPLSSSSAYYSDLSTSVHSPNAGWEVTYETVDTEPNLSPDLQGAVTTNPSSNGRDLEMTQEGIHNAVAVVCSRESSGEEQIVCNTRHHPCSFPLTKTVPSDYV